MKEAKKEAEATLKADEKKLDEAKKEMEAKLKE